MLKQNKKAVWIPLDEILAHAKSFHFSNAKLIKKDNKDIICFQANNISYVSSSLWEDTSGQTQTYENYSGPVLMYKEFANNNCLIWDSPFREVTKFSSKFPQGGRYYLNRSKTPILILDIDLDGYVWLSDKSLEQLEVEAMLARIKLENWGDREVNRKNFIKYLKGQIREWEEQEMYEQMEYDRQNEESEKYWNGMSAMQDDLCNEEINKMNEESEGFWDID